MDECSAGVPDSKKVPNSTMTASSFWPGFPPYQGRLESRKSWSTKKSSYHVYNLLKPARTHACVLNKQDNCFIYFLLYFQLVTFLTSAYL